MEDTRPTVFLATPQPTGNARSNTLSVLYPLTLSLIFLWLLAGKTLSVPKAQAVTAPSAPPAPSIRATEAPTAIPTPAPELVAPVFIQAQKVSMLNIAELEQQKESIRQYVNTIFGRDAKTAFAIALAEDGFNYQGERYFKTSAIHASNVEQSVGLFQINLKSKDALVHYNQVPGAGLSEKIDWLSNPYNNTLFAYWMYSTHANFNPWSVYADGTYLHYMQ